MNLTEIKNLHRSGQIAKPDYIRRMHEQHARLFEYADFIRDTDIARIEISDGSVVMQSRTRGIKLVFSPLDARAVPVEILNFDHYEKTELDMLLRLISPGDSVFDIGANLGWYTCNIAVRFRGQVTLHAFEPIPSTYDCLRRNVELNGLPDVHLHNVGLGREEGVATFFYCQDSSGSASAINIGSRTDAEKLQCEVRTLDGVVRESGGRVDVIKCDVEGAELNVLQGGLDTLRRDRPVLFMEMLRKWSAKFNYHPNDIIALLRGLGYRCFALAGSRLQAVPAVDEKTAATNFLFLHENKHRVFVESWTGTEPGATP